MIFQQNISLRPYNTFRIDVKAQYLFEIGRPEDVTEVLEMRKISPLPKFILGGGSNILFTRNQRKAVLLTCIMGVEKIRETSRYVWIRVGAGENWHRFVLWCVERGYHGVENLSLIPGKVGAAPIQNIGAYGREIKDVFHSLEAFNMKEKTIVRFSNKDCNFEYRSSIFKQDAGDRYIITSVCLRLSKAPVFNLEYKSLKEEIENSKISLPTLEKVCEAVIRIRQRKLPDPLMVGNAGSFFKNPVVDKDHFEAIRMLYPKVPGIKLDDDKVKIPAAYLIEACGWRGRRRGDAGVHSDHALVLVNHANARGKDIWAMAQKISKSILDTFGIVLENEVLVT